MPGRTHNPDNSYRYGFNGKEKDSEGLGGGGSTYDYGFRIYNPSLGRFLSVDPLRGEFPWLSPYQYASNSPIANIDLDGLESQQYWMMKNYLDKVWGFNHTKNQDSEYVKEWASETLDEFAEFSKDELKKTAEKASESSLMMGLTIMMAAPIVVEAAASSGVGVVAEKIGAITFSNSSRVFLSKALGQSSYDAVKQLISKGGDLSEVDFADALAAGLIKNKKARQVIKSFISFKDGELTVAGFNEELNEAFVDLGISFTINAVKEKLDVGENKILKLTLDLVFSETKDIVKKNFEEVFVKDEKNIPGVEDLQSKSDNTSVQYNTVKIIDGDDTNAVESSEEETP